MGLHINIYRIAGDRYDCTNGGISSIERGARGLCLVNVDGPFNPGPDHPAAMLVEHLPFGPEKGRQLARIVPAELNDAEQWEPTKRWAMFGGHYGATSDSRFWEKLREILQIEMINGAVPIHDRFE